MEGRKRPDIWGIWSAVRTGVTLVCQLLQTGQWWVWKGGAGTGVHPPRSHPSDHLQPGCISNSTFSYGDEYGAPMTQSQNLGGCFSVKCNRGQEVSLRQYSFWSRAESWDSRLSESSFPSVPLYHHWGHTVSQPQIAQVALNLKD